MVSDLKVLVILLLTLLHKVSAQVVDKNGLLANRNYNAQEFFCVAQCLGLITTLKPSAVKKSANIIQAQEFSPTTTTQQPKAMKIVEAPHEFGSKTRYEQAPFLAGKPTNCSALNFVGMDECCNKTPRDFLFSTADLEYCYGTKKKNIPGKFIESLNEYVLNQVYSAVPGPSSMDLSLPSNKKRLGNAICYAECLFKKNGVDFGKNKEIDYAEVGKELAKSVSSEWRPIIIDSFVDCATSIPVVHPKKKVDTRQAKKYVRAGYRKDSCYTQPFLLLQCLRKSILLSCPSPNTQLKSAYCDLSRENLRYCDPFKY